MRGRTLSSRTSRRRIAATWVVWEEVDRQVAVAQWRERDLCIVFPLAWARCRQQRALVARAKERIAEVEARAQRVLVPGSVLLAFSRHVPQPDFQSLDPDVPRALVSLGSR